MGFLKNSVCIFLSLILIEKCSCDTYAEKKIFQEPEDPEEIDREEQVTKPEAPRNPFAFKCYECEDCSDTDHLTEEDSCDTYTGCFRYVVSYEQVPEAGNRYKVVLETNVGCIDAYIREFCARTYTNRTGPCVFCYKSFCNIDKPRSGIDREGVETEEIFGDREVVPALVDPVDLMNRKTVRGSAIETKITPILPIFFLLIYSQFYY